LATTNASPALSTASRTEVHPLKPTLCEAVQDRSSQSITVVTSAPAVLSVVAQRKASNCPSGRLRSADRRPGTCP
jgi:hypothetical protein